MKFNKATRDQSSSIILLPFFKHSIDNALIQQLSGQELFHFEGEFKEVSILFGLGKQIFLIGLGEDKHKAKLQEASRSFLHKYNSRLKGELSVSLSHLKDEDAKKFLLGLGLADYKMGVFKTKETVDEDNRIFSLETGLNQEAIVEAATTAETINSIRSLVDAPSNVKTPEYLADWATRSATEHGYACEVFDRQRLKKEGFGSILAVGQGSEHPPVLIKLEYNPTGSAKPAIGLVGKGITFDTGGISIKPSQNMHYMKSDMGGAGAVLGAMELIAKLKLPVHVVGLVASAENAVDAKSFRPGDVITSYSGKTVEIIDTDAEGRLVLSDALSYLIQEHQPEQIIDLATLTGSVVRTFGYTAAGMLTNNDQMAHDLAELGNRIHERVWRLPLYEDFEEDIQSDIADLRNYSNKPVADAICAAKFLEAFTENHTAWVHLDIAGTSFGDSEYSKMKSATGFGVRLLTEYIKQLVE